MQKAMQKKTERLADGRYLLLYTFGHSDTAEAPKPATNEATATGEATGEATATAAAAAQSASIKKGSGDHV